LIASMQLDAAMAVSGGTTSSAAAQALVQEVIQSAASADLGDQAEDLTRALTILDAIPESVVLQGEAAVAVWVDDNIPAPSARPQASLLGCTGAVLAVVASTAIPVAKILKIKKLITALGGVKKAVKLFRGASFSYEKIAALGGAAAALAAELLGIAAVKSACFA
jgi:hypothetical protein